MAEYASPRQTFPFHLHTTSRTVLTCCVVDPFAHNDLTLSSLILLPHVDFLSAEGKDPPLRPSLAGWKPPGHAFRAQCISLNGAGCFGKGLLVPSTPHAF